MNDHATDPRCPNCNAVLLRDGAMCTICDSERLYEAPIRTAPPLRFTRPGEGDTEVGEADIEDVNALWRPKQRPLPFGA